MIGRLLRVVLILALLAWLVQRLCNRTQQQAVHFWVKTVAAGLLTASLLAVLVALFRGHGQG